MSEPTDGNVAREDMITTAVQFLTNHAVKNSALSQKRAFLLKKGLSSEEIEKAFSVAGAYQDEQNRLSNLKSQTVALAPARQVKTPESRWIRIGKYVGIIIIAGGAAHYLYTLYKKYVLPKLMNMASEDERLSKVERELADFRRAMGDSMLQLSSSIAELSRIIQEQSKRMDGPSQFGGVGKDDWQYVQLTNMTELKQEVMSLKGLLLNRKQFPATPSITGLPSWQQVPTSTKVVAGTGDIIAPTNGHANGNKRDSDSENHSEDDYSSPSETPAAGDEQIDAKETEEEDSLAAVSS